jgi:hypothetical protein
MRIRTAKFVMIPMWVMTHPDVRGNATRIATYAGLRAVAWEAPDTEWRSMREVARAVADVNGLGEEAVRKHLAALQRIGAMRRLDDELTIPDDDPKLGTAVGTEVPSVGYDGTQTDQLGLFTTRETKENTPVGTTGGAAGSGDANKEHPAFGRFWERYPRRKDRLEAVRAFNGAITEFPLHVIMEGLDREVAGWRAARRDLSKIPYPATWLNRAGFLNDADQRDRGRAATRQRRSVEAAEAQRSEVERAIADGRHDHAWQMLVERAAGRPDTAWWADAERLHARTNRVISLAVGVDEEAVRRWRTIRESVLAGNGTLVSPLVGELGA